MLPAHPNGGTAHCCGGGWVCSSRLLLVRQRLYQASCQRLSHSVVSMGWSDCTSSPLACDAADGITMGVQVAVSRTVFVVCTMFGPYRICQWHVVGTSCVGEGVELLLGGCSLQHHLLVDIPWLCSD